MSLNTVFFYCLILLVSHTNGDEDIDFNELRTDKEVMEDMASMSYTRIGDMYMATSGPTARSAWLIYQNWPKNEVPYVVSENVTDDLRPVIPHATEYLNKYTCVKFRPANIKKDKYWIRFMMDPDLVDDPDSDVACSAVMGFQNARDQPVLLGAKCDFGSMVHELLHSLGFSHEHSRLDRDKFIAVHFENMQEDAKSQYIRDDLDCQDGNDAEDCKFSDYGVPYNYDSIMHYCDMCGAEGDAPVFTALNNPKALGNPKNTGQSEGLSRGDWYMINRKHGCDPDKNPNIPQPPPIPENPSKLNNFPVPPKKEKHCKKARK